MTALLTRPPLAAEAPGRVRLAAGVLSGVSGALWAAAAGCLGCVAVAVAGWLAGPGGSAGAAVRVGALGWVLGHGGDLALPAGRLGLVPLGVTVFAAALLHRAGMWAALGGPGLPAVAAVVAGVVGGYVVAVVGVAAVAATGSVSVSLWRAGVGAVVVATVGAGSGVVRAAGVAGPAVRWLPEWARASARGGLAGLLVLLGGGAVLVGVGLALDLETATRMLTGLRAGPAGGAVATVAGLTVLPNAAVLGAAFATGAGFALGTGTAVSATYVDLGALPALPLLAAAPAPGPVGWWGSGLLALPVVAGAVGAAVALRRYPAFGLEAALLRGGLTGVVGGLGFGLLAAVAGGPVGPARMADVGPSGWLCAASATAALGVGGVLAGAVIGWRRVRVPAR